MSALTIALESYLRHLVVHHNRIPMFRGFFSRPRFYADRFSGKAGNSHSPNVGGL